MQITDSMMGKFTGAGTEFQEKYTGNHTAVFECELKAPAQLSMIDHNLYEYMMAHRINFRNWKIVDFDNFYQGNSYFAKQMDIKEFTEKVDKLAVSATTHLSKGEKGVIELKSTIEQYEKYLEIHEPSSNENMPIYNEQ